MDPASSKLTCETYGWDSMQKRSMRSCRKDADGGDDGRVLDDSGPGLRHAVRGRSAHRRALSVVRRLYDRPRADMPRLRAVWTGRRHYRQTGPESSLEEARAVGTYRQLARQTPCPRSATGPAISAQPSGQLGGRRP